MIDRRIGRVLISQKITPECLMELVHKDLYILDKHYNFYADEIELIAVHDSFDPISAGEEIPEYTVCVTMLDHIHMQGPFFYYIRRNNNESGIRRQG